jgi:hypothetical protein
MDLIINFQRSIVLARQLLEEFNRTGNIKVLEYLEIVKEDLLPVPSAFPTIQFLGITEAVRVFSKALA